MTSGCGPASVWSPKLVTLNTKFARRNPLLWSPRPTLGRSDGPPQAVPCTSDVWRDDVPALHYLSGSDRPVAAKGEAARLIGRLAALLKELENAWDNTTLEQGSAK